MKISGASSALFLAGASLALSNANAQSTNRYEARAYECDNDLREINPTEARGKEHSQIHICFSPTQETLDRDVYMMRVNWFRFEKEENDSIVQTAVMNGGVERTSTDGRSILLCYGGAETCSLKTELIIDFFQSDGIVAGSGEVEMQFGNGEVRKLQVSTTTAKSSHVLRRKNQEDLTEETDPVEAVDGSFAGADEVRYLFQVKDDVDDNDTVENVKQATKQANKTLLDHYMDGNNFIKFLYVMVIVLSTLLCCCLFAGCCLWRQCCSDDPAYLRVIHDYKKTRTVNQRDDVSELEGSEHLREEETYDDDYDDYQYSNRAPPPMQDEPPPPEPPQDDGQLVLYQDPNDRQRAQPPPPQDPSTALVVHDSNGAPDSRPMSQRSGRRPNSNRGPGRKLKTRPIT